MCRVCRDDVVRERVTLKAPPRGGARRERIVKLIVCAVGKLQQVREIAPSFFFRGHCRGQTARIAPAVALPGEVPESLVAPVVKLRQPGGAPRRRAEAVVAVGSALCVVFVVEEIGGVQEAVALPPVRFAVQAAPAAGRVDVGQRADGVADGGVVGRSLNLELFDRIDGRAKGDARLTVADWKVVWDAVDSEVVVELPVAVGGDL